MNISKKTKSLKHAAHTNKERMVNDAGKQFVKRIKNNSWLVLWLLLLLAACFYTVMAHYDSLAISWQYIFSYTAIFQPIVGVIVAILFSLLYIIKLVLNKPIAKTATLVAYALSFIMFTSILSYLIINQKARANLYADLFNVLYVPSFVMIMSLLLFVGLLSLLFNRSIVLPKSGFKKGATYMLITLGLLTLFVVEFFTGNVRYQLAHVGCGDLPVEASRFMAGNSYTLPQDPTYNPTPFSEYFCTEEQAMRRGFSRN